MVVAVAAAVNSRRDFADICRMTVRAKYDVRGQSSFAADTARHVFKFVLVQFVVCIVFQFFRHCCCLLFFMIYYVLICLRIFRKRSSLFYTMKKRRWLFQRINFFCNVVKNLHRVGYIDLASFIRVRAEQRVPRNRLFFRNVIKNKHCVGYIDLAVAVRVADNAVTQKNGLFCIIEKPVLGIDADAYV